MVWKVKKEMPIGRGSPSAGMEIPGIRDRLAAKKSQYLKNPRRLRFKIMLSATNHRASVSRLRYFSTRRPWV